MFKHFLTLTNQIEGLSLLDGKGTKGLSDAIVYPYPQEVDCVLIQHHYVHFNAMRREVSMRGEVISEVVDFPNERYWVVELFIVPSKYLVILVIVLICFTLLAFSFTSMYFPLLNCILANRLEAI